jgi:hypothetical protein
MQTLLRTTVGSEDGRRFAMAAVLTWADKKWPGLVPPAAWDGEDFEHDIPGFEIGAINLPEQGMWGFRVEHSDSGVAARTWMVEAVVSSEQAFDVLGVRSQCTAGPDGEVPATSPAFLKVWADRLDLQEANRSVSSTAITVAGDDGVQQLVSLLRNPDRQLPVVVVSQAGPGYLIDAERLARRTVGLAHTYRLPAELAPGLIDLLGRESAVFGGAVRTYRPGFGRPNDTQMHVNVLPARIVAWPGDEGSGQGAFLEFLVAQMHRFSVGLPTKLEQMPSFVRLKQYRAERERKQQIERLEALQRDLAAKPSQDGSAELAVLKAQLEEKELDIEILELAKSKAEKDAEDATQLFNLRDAELMASREELDGLRAANQSLLAGFAKLREARAIAIPLPAAYDEIADWVDQSFSDRIFLHPRARRGLKGAVFQDVALVVGCLQLLANEYWSMRVADQEQYASKRAAFEGRMQELGVDEAPSISDSRLGEVEEQYTIHYATERRTKQVLDRHLRGGSNTKDDRYCMRIYFFWDDAQQKVVIGHLPSHLDTRAT